MVLNKNTWRAKVLLLISHVIPQRWLAMGQCRVGQDTTSFIELWSPVYTDMVGTLRHWRQRREEAGLSRQKGFVLPRVTHSSPIPRDTNPFHYDDYSMGTQLVRGWTVMHDGYDNAKEPRPMSYMVLVNTRTGQRIRISLDTSVETAMQPGKYEQFKDWWAWRPVAFGPHIKWLTKIQRRYDVEVGCWFYRNVPPTPDSAPRVFRQR